jgi:hypothetical protein
MARRLLRLVVCLALGVCVTTNAVAARPVVINKTKTDNREVSYASDLCAVGVVPPGPRYEPGPPPVTEPCHRGIWVSELLGFQVVAPRAVPVYISGELGAKGSSRIRAKVILFVDGARVTRKPLLFTQGGGRYAHLQITGTTELPKGAHRVELSIRPVEEEGLVGLTRRFSKLTVSTEQTESPKPTAHDRSSP